MVSGGWGDVVVVGSVPRSGVATDVAGGRGAPYSLHQAAVWVTTDLTDSWVNGSSSSTVAGATLRGREPSSKVTSLDSTASAIAASVLRQCYLFKALYQIPVGGTNLPATTLNWRGDCRTIRNPFTCL